MRDGISEIAAMIIAAVVLIAVPVMMYYVKVQIRVEAEADAAIYKALREANRDMSFTDYEMMHVLRVSALQKNGMKLCYYGNEGVNNGRYGDYIYRVEEEQLYTLLKDNGRIILPEGGLIGAYR